MRFRIVRTKTISWIGLCHGKEASDAVEPVTTLNRAS